MDVKTEENFDVLVHTNVCKLCLSTDRKLSSVNSVSYAYGLMTDWAPLESVHVCWECRALLLRMQRFKLQVSRARILLQALCSTTIAAADISIKCMTRLSVNAQTPFTVGFGSSNEPIELPETKKPIDFESDGEIWAEEISDPNNIKVEVEPEEPRIKPKIIRKSGSKVKKRMKSEVKKRMKSEVKKIMKSEVKNRMELEVKKRMKLEVKKRMESEVKKRMKLEVKKRMKSEAKKRIQSEVENVTGKNEKDIMETYDVTREELNEYKENIFNNIVLLSNFQCRTCTEGFKYEANWKKHNQQFHSEDAGTFICDVCTSRFKSQGALTQHWNKHFQMYRCRYPDCSYVQHKKRSVTQHYANHMIKQDREERRQGQYRGDVLVCDHCGKVCTQRKQLVFHMKSHYKKLMCEHCSYKCSNGSQLKIHMLAHLDPSHRRFECDICNERFTTKCKLLYHTRTHTGERPFQCETCGRGFVCKEFLTHHVKRTHLKGEFRPKKNFLQPRTKSFFINGRGIQKPEDLKTEKTEHKCEQCNKTFKFQSLLLNHIKYVHVGEKSHKCSICSAKFATKHILEAHMSTHSDERRFSCDQCASTFKYKGGLKVHKVTHESNKPFQCNICSLRYATKYSLELHMCSHSDLRPFKCDQCDSTFKYESSLRDHKVIHKGLRPFKCDECNASFKYKTNVKAHKLTHKGDKPHQCTICGTRFTMKGNLTCHMKIHTNERPFECSVCGKTFAWKRNLKNHFKTHVK